MKQARRSGSSRSSGRWLGRRVVAVVVLLILVAGAAVAWASNAAAPMPVATASLQSDEVVQVDQDEWLVFRPARAQPSAGLVFYPGGRVDARAYAPAARSVAAQGFLVAIVPMPLNLAVLAPDRAIDVLAAYPEVSAWAVGGHSLGGAMAARFAHNHPAMVKGLVLWAAYPDVSDDLSASSLEVVSVYASHDGLATPAKIDSSRRLLPQSTRWLEIWGGNHAQFGWYGPQSGDGVAELSHEEQQSIAVAATVDLMQTISERR